MIIDRNRVYGELSTEPVDAKENPEVAAARAAIWPGVITGVTVFVLTTLLDVWLFRRKRSRR